MNVCHSRGQNVGKYQEMDDFLGKYKLLKLSGEKGEN